MQFPDSSSIFIYECEKYIRLLLFKKLQSWRGWFRYLFFYNRNPIREYELEINK